MFFRNESVLLPTCEQGAEVSFDLNLKTTTHGPTLLWSYGSDRGLLEDLSVFLGKNPTLIPGKMGRRRYWTLRDRAFLVHVPDAPRDFRSWAALYVDWFSDYLVLRIKPFKRSPYRTTKSHPLGPGLLYYRTDRGFFVFDPKEARAAI